MKVFRFGKSINVKETTLILGAFSFIHNGHVKLIERARELKKPISVMLIENPEFFKKQDTIQPLADRLQDLSNLGVDYAVVITMTKSIAAKDGISFLNEIKSLVKAKKTISGTDFVLGKNRSLKAKNIKENIIVDLLKINGNKISSSLLAEDILLGNFDDIKKMTPFGYTTTINVKTDNTIKETSFIKKPAGIYAIWGCVNEIIYWGYSHVTTQDKEYIHLPQLKMKNKTFISRIHYVSCIKKIYKSSNDKVTEKDIEIIMKLLSS